jgi:hypothetical protein
LTPHLHGDNLFWPTSSLFFNNKALRKKHCIILVSSDVTEAEDNWTAALVLKLGTEDMPRPLIKNLREREFQGLPPGDPIH